LQQRYTQASDGRTSAIEGINTCHCYEIVG
jgi:hypothetical protein